MLVLLPLFPRNVYDGIVPVKIHSPPAGTSGQTAHPAEDFTYICNKVLLQMSVFKERFIAVQTIVQNYEMTIAIVITKTITIVN